MFNPSWDKLTDDNNNGDGEERGKVEEEEELTMANLSSLSTSNVELQLIDDNAKKNDDDNDRDKNNNKLNIFSSTKSTTARSRIEKSSSIVNNEEEDAAAAAIIAESINPLFNPSWDKIFGNFTSYNKGGGVDDAANNDPLLSSLNTSSNVELQLIDGNNNDDENDDDIVASSKYDTKRVSSTSSSVSSQALSINDFIQMDKLLLKKNEESNNNEEDNKEEEDDVHSSPGSYSSLSLEARALLMSIANERQVIELQDESSTPSPLSKDNNGVVCIDHHDGSSSECTPPKIQRNLQPIELFKDGGRQDNLIKANSNAIDKDEHPRDTNPRKKCHDKDKKDQVLSNDGADGHNSVDNSTLEDTLDNSTLDSSLDNTTLISGEGTKESASLHSNTYTFSALAQQVGSSMPTWLEDVVDKIDDATYGKFQCGEYPSDGEESDDGTEYKRNSSSSSGSRVRKRQSSLHHRARERRRRERMHRRRNHRAVPAAVEEGEGGGAELANIDNRDGGLDSPQRAYLVRFSPGTIPRDDELPIIADPDHDDNSFDKVHQLRGTSLERTNNDGHVATVPVSDRVAKWEKKNNVAVGKSAETTSGSGNEDGAGGKRLDRFSRSFNHKKRSFQLKRNWSNKSTDV